MYTLEFKVENGTPVFAYTGGPGAGSAFGATLVQTPQFKGYLYPAYLPFGITVLNQLKTAIPDLQFSEQVYARYETLRRDTENLKHWYVDPAFEFGTAPFEVQKQGLAWINYLPRSGLLLDCGLGKTKVTIDLIQYLRFKKDPFLRFNAKTLVLCPKNILHKWPDQVSIHSRGQLTAIAISGTPEQKLQKIEQAKNYDVVIVTFDTNRRYLEQIKKHIDFDIIVADESYNLQTWETNAAASNRKSDIPNKTTGALQVSGKAGRRIILCGSASLGTPLNMYGQLRFMCPQIVPNRYTDFLNSHTQKGKGKHIIIGYKNLDELNAKVTTLCLRKRIDDCMDIPERNIQTIDVFISPEQRDAYNDMATTLTLSLPEWELDAKQKAVAMQKLLQITGGIVLPPTPGREICRGCSHLETCLNGDITPFTKKCVVFPTKPVTKPFRFPKNPKLEALVEFLETLFQDPARKVIIWAHFTEELNLIEETLLARKWGYVRVDGSNSEQGFELSQVFTKTKALEDESAPGARVYLGQISVCQGLDLHESCNYSIDYSIDHSHKNWEQRLGRTRRIGQRFVSFHYVLIMKQTLDNLVYLALQSKGDIDDTITIKPDCLTCFRNIECFHERILPFKPGCVFQSRAKRISTPIKPISDL